MSTIEDALAEARREYDECVTKWLARHEARLRARGVTEKKIAREVERCRGRLIEARTERLAEIEADMRDVPPGASFN